MPGIRLHHPTLRAGEGTTLTYVVELPLEWEDVTPTRNRAAEPCPTCATPHARKALHLRLDSNGDVIVAVPIYEQLKQIPTMAGLELVNEIAAPPPLRIGAVHRDKARIVQATAEHIVPEQTRWDARDKIQAPFVPVLDELNTAIDKKLTKKKAEKRSIHALSGPKKKGR